MNYRFIILIFFYIYLALRCVISNTVNRIIGGEDSDIASVPYVLALRINNKYSCGAVILDKNYIATAAHCAMAAKYPGEISVCSGMSSLNENCIVHIAKKICVHHKYNYLNNDYDIAVIKVFPQFTFNHFTRAVNLAPDNAQEIFTACGITCGWGYHLKSNGMIVPNVSQHLKCVIIPLINKQLCEDCYQNRFVLTTSMTCYGFQDGMKDTCKGDSGGPLVNKDDILIGINSWGDGCAKEKSPGVYTDTVYLKDWIKIAIKMKASYMDYCKNI